ncbi:potassium channel beta subunit family protein [Opitutus terrae]|uniref:Aldo/keto reductase n=1 Tax=Opitutus terrae (strain DSM 11246 / JCM 15787 / PB90-1) TaxID=452637 RepID=B1ZNY4_OPITP|nr:aldo/keto reductase [Opitutus terrae]ACB77473.1 aldo/keto reductase [Opitutus terrae PB90-1]
MHYRQLGPSGLKISALSFGAWVTFGKQIGDAVATKLLHTAYDAGVNFFDNAEAYADGQAELVMGTILKKSGWRRSSYLVSSKVYFGWEDDKPNQSGLSRKHVVDACHDALRRLQVDYLDLYYCHRPDPSVPIYETARAMHDLIVQGKVLYWGTSEWSATELREAHRVCAAHDLHAPVVEQPQYNLFHRARVEKEYGPLYKSPGLGTTIWSPLASGILTGKYTSGVPKNSRLDAPGMEWLRDMILNDPAAKAKIAAVPRLAAIADGLGTSLPKLAIAWCLKNPHVSSVILGASRVEQLQENLGALAVVDQLTPAVMRQLNAIAKPVAT